MYIKKLTGRLLILVFLITALIVSAWPSSFLQIVVRKSGRTIFLEPVKPGEAFVLSYIHSVENTPVSGTFEITQEGRIEVIKTVFSSYGTGLPLFAPREQIHREKGKMVVNHENEIMEKIPLVVVEITKQRVHFRNIQFLFSDFVKDGTIVDIRVIHQPLYKRILGALF
jgi:hypothetical protein